MLSATLRPLTPSTGAYGDSSPSTPIPSGKDVYLPAFTRRSHVHSVAVRSSSVYWRSMAYQTTFVGSVNTIRMLIQELS
jgi:hypothetical protein